jgi:hypothetical protein
VSHRGFQGDAADAFKPEVLNHHAAQIDVRRSVADVRYDVTLGGLLNVLEAARKAGSSSASSTLLRRSDLGLDIRCSNTLPLACRTTMYVG